MIANLLKFVETDRYTLTMLILMPAINSIFKMAIFNQLHYSITFLDILLTCKYCKNTKILERPFFFYVSFSIHVKKCAHFKQWIPKLDMRVKAIIHASTLADVHVI